MPYRAKKRLGQHFLISKETADRIAALAEPGSGKVVVEVGPGRGALTLPLARSGARVIAVELDRDLVGYLKALLRDFDDVTVLNQDFLAFDPNEHRLSQFVLVGNLPYNITSPVVDWIVQHRLLIPRAVLMVQREVADRLASKPGSKAWGPLGLLTQLHYHIEARLQVAAAHFRPRPQVGSTVVELTRLAGRTPRPPVQLEEVVRWAFEHRRKMLTNNLLPHLGLEAAVLRRMLGDLGLAENVRAEQVTTEQFIALTERLLASGRRH